MKNTEILSISEIQVYPIQESQGKLRAFVRLILGGQLQLTSLRIYDGSQGLFVSYPNDPLHKGNDYRQLYYPLSKDLRNAIEKAILDEYKKTIDTAA